MIKLRLFDYLDRYLLDNDYKVTICGDSIHIMNYMEVEDFSSTKIIVKHTGGKTVIFGSDLVISKMQDDELYIRGKLKGIEYN